MWPQPKPSKRPQHVRTIDPDKTWIAGLVGMLTRYRGLFSLFSGKLIFAAAALKWMNWHAALTIVLVGAGLIACLWITRIFFLRYIRCSERLHAICHEFRDELPNLTDVKASKRARGDALQRVLNEFVNQIAAIYRHQFADDSTRCALRLLDQSGENFTTVARSTGFEKSRKTNSEPVPVSAGLAKAIREKDAQGVFLIPDIPTAIEDEIWHPTKTDGLPDVKFLMVAPVNVVDRKQKQTVGILYVSSLKRRFSGPDTLSMKAFSDYLGTVLAVVADADSRMQKRGKAK
ncbi:hypothetical protein FF011L_05580 [Roseimaritima multifibrata]|uniref:GAF domain-containing protein n=1 Tax=Roseimaritima multifibrata TaxID=1930274 RepID=A0A517MAB1_9BACT|nr:hypothetical protein FF011L_05580 [Roseimaritima multifibrata]